MPGNKIPVSNTVSIEESECHLIALFQHLAQIVTCKEIVDEEDKDWYKRKAGFLLVDREAAIEEIEKSETQNEPEVDPFAGLYNMNAGTEDRWDRDVKQPDGEIRLGNKDGFEYCQPPTAMDARLALEDLKHFLNPWRQKQNGLGAGYSPCKTSLDPIIRAWLDDIQSFLWWYCGFDTNRKSQNPSAGHWIQASLDIASYRMKEPWRA
jgi:hypothetical protein